MYASVEVSREADGPHQNITLLVDTGATDSIVPRDLLASLGIAPLRTEEFELADGRKIPREVGVAWFAFMGRSGPALVIFGEPADAPVLGVIALEMMGLELDPRSGTFREAKRLLIAAKRLAPSPLAA